MLCSEAVNTPIAVQTVRNCAFWVLFLRATCVFCLHSDHVGVVMCFPFLFWKAMWLWLHPVLCLFSRHFVCTPDFSLLQLVCGYLSPVCPVLIIGFLTFACLLTTRLPLPFGLLPENFIKTLKLELCCLQVGPSLLRVVTQWVQWQEVVEQWVIFLGTQF